MMGDEYTIADIATFPWVRNLKVYYEADALVGLKDFPNVMAWVERALERPASQQGLKIPSRG